MRITKDMLIKITQDLVAQRTRDDRDILAVYLHGSLLHEDYLLGGTTDIDLFFVHNDSREESREILRVTDEFHYDIAHQPRSTYRYARQLRIHPWLGPALNSCKILYDPQHFLDFAQASVRGQFNSPANILQRARPQVEKARQIWLAFETNQAEPGPQELHDYLRAVAQAANGVASLVGEPLTERRFLIDFQTRAARLKRPGLFAGLLGLIGAPQLDSQALPFWLEEWHAAYTALPVDQAPVPFHPQRLFYYERAFESLLAEGKLPVLLWPLLYTWTRMIALLPAESPRRALWQKAGLQLSLLGPDFRQRITALDAYLDLIEETLESWILANGA